MKCLALTSNMLLLLLPSSGGRGDQQRLVGATLLHDQDPAQDPAQAQREAGETEGVRSGWYKPTWLSTPNTNLVKKKILKSDS